jgi:ferrous iron transport protein A
MPMPIKNLKDLRAGESGKIAYVEGGWGIVRRLAALDIRPGRKITKISSGFIRGPITVEVNRVQIAIGFGMANRIFIEVGDNT